ncbi:hypothetical protein [Segniliparus rugosus]|uniref:hypothetical protein n=1 Tax=Segniliparus rugosus TaxID=286804 RepID=UPI0012EBA242|nr:hypothetical protein [Segniliparus rugosus]
MRFVGIVMAVLLCAGCFASPPKDLLALPPGVPDPADYPDVTEQYRVGDLKHKIYGFKTAEGIRCLVIVKNDPQSHDPLPGESGAQCIGHLPGNGLSRLSTSGHPDGFDSVSSATSTITPGLFDEEGHEFDGPASGYTTLEPGHRVALCVLTKAEELSCSSILIGVPDHALVVESGQTMTRYQQGKPGPYREGFVIGPDRKVRVFDNGKET